MSNFLKLNHFLFEEKAQFQKNKSPQRVGESGIAALISIT